MRKSVSTWTVPLFVVVNAAARQVVARADDTLQSVIEIAIQSASDRWGYRGFRVLDSARHEQPLDVEVGLLGYERGKALYVYPPLGA